MSLTLYGLKSCDSCRRATRWLRARDVDFDFHDVRDDGVDSALLERWLGRVDWQTLVNRRSLTWRNIPAADKENMSEERAVATMLEHPTLIKRPVLDGDEFTAVGFSPDRYEALFARR